MNYSIKCFSLFIFFLVLFANHSFAQSVVASSGCVQMVGGADITNNGAYYSCYIKNDCSDYILTEKSKYKVKFEGYNRDGETKYKSKTINFPDVFLKPNSSIYKDKSGFDNGSLTYNRVMYENGDMGSTYKGYSGVPVDGAIRMFENSKMYIGSKDGVEFSLIIQSSSSNWEGNYYTKYKVGLIAVNTNAYKVKPDAYLYYDIYFHGQPYAGDLSVKSMGANDVKNKQESENCLFNFVPEIYVKIKNTNLSLDGMGRTEGVEGESSSSSSSSSSPPVVDSNRLLIEKYFLEAAEKFESKEYEESMELYRKTIELDKKKSSIYYTSYYNTSLCYWKLAYSFFQNGNFEDAKEYYKLALADLVLAEKAIELNSTISQEMYSKSVEDLKNNLASSEQKIKDKANAETLFKDLIKAGDASEAKGDFATAVQKYEEAKAMNKDDALVTPKLNAAKVKLELNLEKEKKEAAEKDKIEAEKAAKEKAIAEKAKDDAIAKEFAANKILFEDLIKAGDSYLSKEDFDNALIKYEQARVLNVDEGLVTSKVTTLNEKKDFLLAKENEMLAKEKAIREEKEQEENERLKLEYEKRFSEFGEYNGKNYTTVNVFGNEWFVENISSTKDNQGNSFKILEKAKYFEKDGPGENTSISACMQVESGVVYNWHAAQSGLICPEGSHLSTIAEWEQIIESLGGVEYERKEKGSGIEVTYRIENKLVLNYNKNFKIATESKMSGWGLVFPANYVAAGKLEKSYSNAIYWSWNPDDSKAYLIRINEPYSDDDDSISIIIWSVESTGGFNVRANSCKCVKD